MIGLEVLTWGTEGHDSAYYYPVYHYLWGGSMGHSALKLTLPCNPEVDGWIQRYCQEGHKSLIPHYQVTRNQSGQTVSQWIVYFSWWPGELQEEYDDRMSANLGTRIQYAEKWQSQFSETMTEGTGYLRHRFGFLYDMIFGKPKQIPKPISYIVHPSQEQAQLLQEMRVLEQQELQYAQQECELLTSLSTVGMLEQRMHYFFLRTKRQLEHCLSEAEEIGIQQNMTKKCQEILDQIDKLSVQLDPLLDNHQKLKQELIAMRRHICEQVVSVGSQPQVVHLSIAGKLSPEKMLKTMHQIVKGPFEFHKFLFNCSTAVREVIEGGLDPLLQGREGLPHLFDTPVKIRRFALNLQAKLFERLSGPTQQPSRELLLQYPAAITQARSAQANHEAPKATCANRPL